MVWPDRCNMVVWLLDKSAAQAGESEDREPAPARKGSDTETIEYRAIDKSAWGDGPWQDEPDKKQWRDEATGMLCLIVRGPTGALCGYVGVLPSHPAHGLHYDGVTNEAAEARADASREDMRKWREADYPPLHEWYASREPLPEAPVVPGAGEMLAGIEVHGGLTFADGCADLSRATWEKFRARVPSLREEAARFPVGDAARLLHEWALCIDDYDAWVERKRATAIVPAPGEPADLWWFGFDCSHAGDYAPAFDFWLGGRLGAPTGWGTVIEYRDLAYVEREVVGLARQLVEIGKRA